jgi:hypothetical protein
MTERLLSYSLGRGLESTDMPTVRRIVREEAASNNRFSSMVLGIVKSQVFQMNQAPHDLTGRDKATQTIASN